MILKLNVKNVRALSMIYVYKNLRSPMHIEIHIYDEDYMELSALSKSIIYVCSYGFKLDVAFAFETKATQF